MIVFHAMIVIMLGRTARLLAASRATSSTGVCWTAASASAAGDTVGGRAAGWVVSSVPTAAPVAATIACASKATHGQF